jgi:hypothetical protein
MAEFIDAAFAPVFLCCSDMLLLFYLCGGTRETVRKKKLWGLWFFLCLFTLASTQFMLNGKTGQEAKAFAFYLVRFLLFFIFTGLCTDLHFNASCYMIILVMVSMDVCLIAFVRTSLFVFRIDYLVNGPIWLRAINHVLLLSIKIVVAYTIKRRTKTQIFGIESFFQAVAIILPAIPYFYLRDYARWFSIPPAETPWSVHFVTLLCGICAITNMILSENYSYQIRQNEKLHMEGIIRKQHDQYKTMLNNIEGVNRKYHDLRHILRGIDSMDSIDEIKTYVQGVEGEIKDYELIYNLYNTGNKTIDIIFSEKKRVCYERNIQLHIHAEGQGWGQVSDMDAATIFGNALDNAIESVEPIEDQRLKLIDVRIGVMNEMLVARFENHYIHELQMDKEKLLSTKMDRENHGYGLKSIELTVKKYGGDVDVKAKDGVFVLTVIIPTQHSV